jgi:hypothetical protein
METRNLIEYLEIAGREPGRGAALVVAGNHLDSDHTGRNVKRE